MKKAWIKWSFIVGAVVFIGTLPSCHTNTYYYAPHVQVPSHQEKGDLDINLQGLAYGSASVNYAVTKNLCIGGSYTGYASRDSFDNRSEYFRTIGIDGGYFYNNPNSNFNVSVMGSYGTGSVGNDDRNDFFGVDFTRAYIQPSISYISDRRNLENHFSFRYSWMSFGEQTNRTPHFAAFNVRYFEPTYTVRVGSPNVRFHAQMGLAWNLTDDDLMPNEYISWPIIIGFGIHANLNVLNMLNK